MKPRRLRDHGKPARMKRIALLRCSTPLTVEQVRAIEQAWAAKAGRSCRVEAPAPLPTAWWKRWVR